MSILIHKVEPEDLADKKRYICGFPEVRSLDTIELAGLLRPHRLRVGELLLSPSSGVNPLTDRPECQQHHFKVKEPVRHIHLPSLSLLPSCSWSLSLSPYTSPSSCRSRHRSLSLFPSPRLSDVNLSLHLGLRHRLSPRLSHRLGPRLDPLHLLCYLSCLLLLPLPHDGSRCL